MKKNILLKKIIIKEIKLFFIGNICLMFVFYRKKIQIFTSLVKGIILHKK